MVDEYHLEILRGADMMGRWYLADVEVKREIAERFTLFLGDDEMEFLADDALVFAYEGVTRMQQGWVNAKRRKRRHRRAADYAARRKDEAPLEPEPVEMKADERTQKTPARTTKAPTSELAKKLAAIAAAEAAAGTGTDKRRFTWAEAEELELANAASASADPKPAPTARKPRKRPPAAKPDAPPEAPTIEIPVEVSKPVEQPPAAAAPEPPKRRRTPKPPPSEPEVMIPAPALPEPVMPEPVMPEPVMPEPVMPEPVMPEPVRSEAPLSEGPMPEVAEGEWRQPEYPEPAWIAPKPTRLVTVDLSVEEPVVIETPVQASPPVEEPEPVLEPEPSDQDPDDELNKRRQRRKSRRESAEKDPVSDQDDQAPVRQVTDIEAARIKVKEPRGSGHHPAETNVGLLAKLRRPPKANEEHVHTYQESRSAGGLTRRVCVECNHVSITSDD